jgi:hypothetical protein
MAGYEHFTQEQVSAGLMAMIAWVGNASAASRALKAEKGLVVSPKTLHEWVRERHFDQYNEMRVKYSEQLETGLANDMRDSVRAAIEVERVAMDKALVRLKAGEDPDPAKTAAHAARVAQSMTDKLLSLTGRPTSIREDRNVQEILRSLAAKGVIDLGDKDVSEESPALGAGDV